MQLPKVLQAAFHDGRIPPHFESVVHVTDRERSLDEGLVFEHAVLGHPSNDFCPAPDQGLARDPGLRRRKVSFSPLALHQQADVFTGQLNAPRNLGSVNRIAGLDAHDGQSRICTFHITYSREDCGVEARGSPVKLQVPNAIPKCQRGIIATRVKEGVLEAPIRLGDAGEHKYKIVRCFLFLHLFCFVP